jgi:hypothetical protein
MMTVDYEGICCGTEGEEKKQKQPNGFLRYAHAFLARLIEGLITEVRTKQTRLAVDKQQI